MASANVGPLTLFWFRRDLRLHDNAGLYHALKEHKNVRPIFIFDSSILSRLQDVDDARVTFIHQSVNELREQLRAQGADLVVRHGEPLKVLQEFCARHPVEAIYTNHDYEPEARRRDEAVENFCRQRGLVFRSFKDQCLFEKSEILTDAGRPYTVYTPYKKKVLAHLSGFYLKSYPNDLYFSSLAKGEDPAPTPSLQDLGFRASSREFPPLRLFRRSLQDYERTRDIPALREGTSRLGLHLRFGTVSVRELAREGKKYSPVWLSELIWRDFFMQILWHFPEVEKRSFRPEYERVAWRDAEDDFDRWCEGRTGYPLVDAGMRELNATGHMHNRVRMVTASFLCKHLLIHWSRGERYFARRLLDFDLAANNGNWQWAAGSGCDAAPYFRIFNPSSQAQKFDPAGEYIRRWVPEVESAAYPAPMVDHVAARERCLKEYTRAVKEKQK